MRSTAPSDTPVVSDREARVRKLEKCLGEVDGDLKSIRSGFAIGKWIVGLMMASVLTLGGYVVKTTIQTAAAIEDMEDSQLVAREASTAQTRDARTIQVKLGEISAHVQNLRESQRTGDEDLKDRLENIERRLDRRGFPQ